MNFDSKQDTEAHIRRVRALIAPIFHAIASRHEDHDASKLKEPEKSTFDRVTPLLRAMTYGSKEYEACRKEMKPALDHHYAHNRHHPEHFKDGMKGMTLVDLIEMFCDWCAATERHEDGNIGRSIEHNMKRFGYGETLAGIFVNTAQEYLMGRRNHVAYRPAPNNSTKETPK